MLAHESTAGTHRVGPLSKLKGISMIAALKTPYLLFLGTASSLGDAKTAAGIAYWRRDLCCGQLRLPGCKADIGLPDLDLEAAQRLGRSEEHTSELQSPI